MVTGGEKCWSLKYFGPSLQNTLPARGVSREGGAPGIDSTGEWLRRLSFVRTKNTMASTESSSQNHVYQLIRPTQLPSWHRLGPLHVPFEAQGCRHVAVAIPIAAIGGLITVRSRQLSPQPQ
jgi:predicted DNA-binding transcriptional regulator AlpA